MRGGSKGTRYSLSGSVLNQDGTILNSGFRRYQGRVTLDQDVRENLRVGLNANFSNIFTNGTSVSGSSNSDFALLTSLYGYRPIIGSGNLGTLLDNAEDDDVVSSSTTTSGTRYLRCATSCANTPPTSSRPTPTPSTAFGRSLKLRVTGGVDRRSLRYDVFNNSQTRTGNLNNPNGQNGVNGSVTYTEQNNYVNENTLDYNKAFSADHRLNALVGFTAAAHRVLAVGQRGHSDSQRAAGHQRPG